VVSEEKGVNIVAHPAELCLKCAFDGRPETKCEKAASQYVAIPFQASSSPISHSADI